MREVYSRPILRPPIVEITSNRSITSSWEPSAKIWGLHGQGNGRRPYGRELGLGSNICVQQSTKKRYRGEIVHSGNTKAEAMVQVASRLQIKGANVEDMKKI